MDLLDENDGTPGVQAIPDVDRQERLDGAGQEVKKRRGRPPGSKNRPKEDERTARLERLAAVVSLVFFLISIVMRWFGLQKKADLTKDEMLEGARHLEPLSDRLGFVLSIASWIGFPLWLIAKVQDKFRKVESRKESPPTQIPGGPAPLANENANSLDSPGGNPVSLEEVADPPATATGTIG